MTQEPPYAETLTRHQHRMDSWTGTDETAQRQAEREGHVPPGVKPVAVTRWPHSRDIVWEWITGEDPTGQTVEVWFADGPLKGQSRAIPYRVEVGDRLPAKAWPLAGANDAEAQAREEVYEVHQREDGLWFGRCEP